ncbi:hypothetical protein HQ533_03970 [Candidatus Woesearchaeota archaeon]|nr:hypothetical protein [Candidatus Woesearchaeota archaeon]
MEKIAIDIALLLPEEINNICININRSKGVEAFSDLSKHDNHPHITLAMGVIDENQIDIVNNKLEEITKDFSGFDLEIIDIFNETTPENKTSTSFVIKPNAELKELHEKIMNELLPIFTYNVSKEMFFIDSDEDYKEVSEYWVENYGTNHKYPEKYRPHISLKCRHGKYNSFPVKFFTNKLVMCQLGNYCTCRKILFEVNL